MFRQNSLVVEIQLSDLQGVRVDAEFDPGVPLADEGQDVGSGLVLHSVGIVVGTWGGSYGHYCSQLS